MKLSLNNIVKLYSVSNIVFYRISDNINNNLINANYDNIYNIVLCHKFEICNSIPIILLILYYANRENLIIKKKYNKILLSDHKLILLNNIKKAIDFICIAILIIFIKNIENAI